MIVSSPGAAHEAVQVGAHGHAGAGLDLNAVNGHAIHGSTALARIGAVNHLGLHAGLHGFQHVAAGQVNGAGAVKGQGDIGLVRCNQRGHHAEHVAARKKVRFQTGSGGFQSGLDRHDAGIDDGVGAHFAQAHGNERQEGHMRARHRRLDVQPAVLKDENQKDETDQRQNADDQALQRQHARHPCRCQAPHAFLLIRKFRETAFNAAKCLVYASSGNRVYALRPSMSTTDQALTASPPAQPRGWPPLQGP